MSITYVMPKESVLAPYFVIRCEKDGEVYYAGTESCDKESWVWTDVGAAHHYKRAEGFTTFKFACRVLSKDYKLELIECAAPMQVLRRAKGEGK